MSELSGGWRRRVALATGAGTETPTCCCWTSQPIISTLPQSAGSRSASTRFPVPSCSLHTIAPFCSAWPPASSKWTAASSSAGPATTAITCAARKKRSRTRTPRTDVSTRSSPRKRAWIRQGIKARRRRNEGRVRTLVTTCASNAPQRVAHGSRMRPGIHRASRSVPEKKSYEAKPHALPWLWRRSRLIDDFSIKIMTRRSHWL